MNFERGVEVYHSNDVFAMKIMAQLGIDKSDGSMFGHLAVAVHG